MLLFILGYCCLSVTSAKAAETVVTEIPQIAQNEPDSVQTPVQDAELLDSPSLILETTPSEQSDLVLEEGPGVQDDLTVGSPSEKNPDFSGVIATPAPPLGDVTEDVIVYTPVEAPTEVVVYTPVEAPEPEAVIIATALPVDAPPALTPVSTKQVAIENVTFLCGEDGNDPATVAKNKDEEEFFVIVWKSGNFETAGYDDQTRCKQVSARFEEYNKGKLLTYLATGKLNGQPVICLTSKADGSCGDESISLHQGLLFTLKPNENSDQTLEELVAVIDGRSGQKRLEQ